MSAFLMISLSFGLNHEPLPPPPPPYQLCLLFPEVAFLPILCTGSSLRTRERRTECFSSACREKAPAEKVRRASRHMAALTTPAVEPGAGHGRSRGVSQCNDNTPRQWDYQPMPVAGNRERYPW